MVDKEKDTVKTENTENEAAPKLDMSAMVKENDSPQEAPALNINEVAQGDDAPQEKPHKISNNACRWLYFVFTLLLIGALGLVQYNHTIITVFQWTFDVDGTRAFIEGFSTWFSSGVQTGVQAMTAMVIAALTVAATIIFIVRFIILLVTFFSFLKLGNDREKLHLKFRKAIRQVAKLAGFYLLIDFLLIIVGSGMPSFFMIDIIVLATIFGLSSLNYWLYEAFNKEGKFSISLFIMNLVNIGLYTFMGVLVGIYLTRFDLLTPFIDGINTASSSGNGVDPLKFIYPGVAFVFGLVGTIFGTNIITKTVYYFPHNDVGKKIKYGLLQKKNLVSSILILVFFGIVGTSQFLGGTYTAITDMIVPVLLVPIVLLAMSICLLIAYKADNPIERKEEKVNF